VGQNWLAQTLLLHPVTLSTTMGFMDQMMTSTEPPAELETPVKRKRGEIANGSASSKDTSMIDVTMQLDLLKLASNSAQKIRLMASIMMWTLMLPMELLQSAVDFAKKFGTENKGQKHNKGSPHPQIWRIVLSEMVSAAKTLLEKVENEQQQHLQPAISIVEKHIKGLADSGPKKAYFHIRQAQVRATRDENKGISKFEVSQLLVNPREVQMAILYFAEALGGSVLEGTEAATDLERKIQNHIDKLK